MQASQTTPTFPSDDRVHPNRFFRQPIGNCPAREGLGRECAGTWEDSRTTLEWLEHACTCGSCLLWVLDHYVDIEACILRDLDHEPAEEDLQPPDLPLVAIRSECGTITSPRTRECSLSVTRSLREFVEPRILMTEGLTLVMEGTFGEGLHLTLNGTTWSISLPVPEEDSARHRVKSFSASAWLENTDGELYGGIFDGMHLEIDIPGQEEAGDLLVRLETSWEEPVTAAPGWLYRRAEVLAGTLEACPATPELLLTPGDPYLSERLAMMASGFSVGDEMNARAFFLQGFNRSTENPRARFEWAFHGAELVAGVPSVFDRIRVGCSLLLEQRGVDLFCQRYRFDRAALRLLLSMDSSFGRRALISTWAVSPHLHQRSQEISAYFLRPTGQDVEPGRLLHDGGIALGEGLLAFTQKLLSGLPEASDQDAGTLEAMMGSAMGELDRCGSAEARGLVRQAFAEGLIALDWATGNSSLLDKSWPLLFETYQLFSESGATSRIDKLSERLFGQMMVSFEHLPAWVETDTDTGKSLGMLEYYRMLYLKTRGVEETVLRDAAISALHLLTGVEDARIRPIVQELSGLIGSDPENPSEETPEFILAFTREVDRRTTPAVPPALFLSLLANLPSFGRRRKQRPQELGDGSAPTSMEAELPDINATVGIIPREFRGSDFDLLDDGSQIPTCRSMINHVEESDRELFWGALVLGPNGFISGNEEEPPVQSLHDATTVRIHPEAVALIIGIGPDAGALADCLERIRRREVDKPAQDTVWLLLTCGE